MKKFSIWGYIVLALTFLLPACGGGNTGAEGLGGDYPTVGFQPVGQGPTALGIQGKNSGG